MLRDTSSAAAKPLVGVSACLLGHAVRYDGNDKRNDFIVDQLGQQCDFLPVCPEAEAGLGIPRPPVQLVGDLNKCRARGRDDPQLDVTDRLENFSRQQLLRLDKISGYIFKSRSPSCGLVDTPIFNPDRLSDFQSGAGIFAGIVTSFYPSLPVCDENMLNDPDFAEEFIHRVLNHHASIIASP